MPDQESSFALDSFITDLKKAWQAAGPPSYKELEQLSRKFTAPDRESGLRVMVLAPSTTHEILTGRRRGLPKWHWVASFLAVLRVAAAQSGVDPDSIGTLAQWKAKHESVDTMLRLSRRESGNIGEAAAPGKSRPAGHNSARVSVVGTAAVDWWRPYSDVLPEGSEIYLSFEPAACLMRTYHAQVVPELLQTEQYARSAIRLQNPAAGECEIERRVELLMRRQQILHRADAPRLWAITRRSVLHERIAGDAVMRAQIKQLIEWSERPHITIQLVPEDGFGAAVDPFTILRFRESELPDVVHVERDAGDGDRPIDIQHYDIVHSWLAVAAESPAASRAYLHYLLSKQS